MELLQTATIVVLGVASILQSVRVARLERRVDFPPLVLGKPEGTDDGQA